VRNLSSGDRGKEVSDVQTRLRAQGFELGNEGVDGFFGPKTTAATRAFQQERGLLVDGIVGANTWRELVEAGYALGDRLLYLRVPNFRGDDVLALQVKLNLFGFNAGPERGIYDEQVEQAVLEFQRNAGLPPDGIVGDSTLVKLDALRKAETGRESKKIPDRDAGYLAARSLTGLAIVIDPGHGGSDRGCVTASGLDEKSFSLALATRLAQLLRAEGCRVTLTRESDETIPLYARAEVANATGATFFLSLHLNENSSPLAAGSTCSYFQRSHYYSERGKRLADSIGVQLTTTGHRFLGSFGRNYAVLRESRAIAVLVEPFYASNPDEAQRAQQPDYIETLAQALTAGLAAYVTRT
jgi:N-acetylmuramoyl-L-alanine amidase